MLFCNLYNSNVFGENYQALSPGDGIGLVYSPNIELNGFRLALVVDRETNLIDVDFSSYNLNETKSGNIALVLPYHGTLDENTDWQMKSFERNTVLIKEYKCSEEKPCRVGSQEFLRFVFEGKLDTKESTHHIIGFEIWNSAPAGDEYDYILSFKNHQEHYDIGFGKLQNAKAIVIVENTASNIRENPPATYDRFENRGTGYENKQIVWDISELKFASVEYDVLTKSDVIPGTEVMTSEVQKTIGIVWQDYILPIIVTPILGGFVWVYVSRRLKGKLKIKEIEFKTYDFHGMNLYYISAKITSSHEKVLKEIEVKVEVKKDGKLIKMKSFEYHKKNGNESSNEKSIEWEPKGVNWFKDSKFNDMRDKLEQIKKGDEWFFKFPAHGIWFAGIGVGSSTSTMSSYDYGLDLKQGEKYMISIFVRGVDQVGHTETKKISKQISF
jgi:hypothetical protein